MSGAQRPVWLQATLAVPAALSERVEAALSAVGALSVTLADAGDQPVLEPAPGETPLWSRTTVTGLFDGHQVEAQSIALALINALGSIGAGVQVTPLQPQDWVDAWRQHFHPMRFGRRLWVCPHQVEPPDPAAATVWLDPGLAFGTGTHPTTALCLEWLDAHPPRGEAIDYGCGSGILALAAARLGARKVLAVDIDPQALAATRENARRNSLERQVATYLPQQCPVAAVDLGMANILAAPLITLAAVLASRLRPGADLILAGLLPRHAPAVLAAYEPWFEAEGRREREGWVRLDLVRRSRPGAVPQQ